MEGGTGERLKSYEVEGSYERSLVDALLYILHPQSYQRVKDSRAALARSAGFPLESAVLLLLLWSGACISFQLLVWIAQQRHMRDRAHQLNRERCSMEIVGNRSSVVIKL